ncbi:DUF6531 domain-containing protein [Demequina sp. TTPB684]|uniref:DUF6531 domain-containing protein n=1 Tax=unclassified Demequina TaxID=2620311 RepID=UPI001CF3DBCE|nr:DUF6531 domain-containing protein [Demequina sp. TMPB413]MCB2411983.1 DUF6531 domain-containing protein [Demequina sp. TTPB684]UPU87426.1 DUF6531 domain-containing protein [Demequina sp. TMPB413]
MRRSLRSTVSAVVAGALLVAVPVAVEADEPDGTLSATDPSSYDLPEGGTVVFNPTDPAGTGATVEVATLDTSGATAAAADGEVAAIGDGVEITATTPGGDDITVLEHDVVITPATEELPALNEVTPAIELTFPVLPENIEGIDLSTLGVYSRENADEPWVWVPSAYDPELGAVVAQSDHLSEFTVMGSQQNAMAATAAGQGVPRIALDPDDLVGKARWNGTNYNELQFSASVATEVKNRLVAECSAEVLITRDASTPFVNRTTRANLIRNFDADIAMTLAFNTYNTAPDGIARPWGIESDGGIVAWSANNSASIGLGNSIKSNIANYTGRSDRRRLNPTDDGLPYSQLVGSAPAYAHAELLFLDHNYDWPVISTRRDLVVDAVFASIVQQIETTSGIACAEPVTLPEPPSQAEIDRLTQLGKNNYQIYGTDPVNLSTGNFVSSEEVFTLTGVGDQELDLVLAYNALDGRDSPVGRGWNFAFASRVQRFSDGAVLATLADGRRVSFTPDGDGGYTANGGGQASLADVADGVVMTFPDRTTLEFSVDEESGYGELTRTVDRQGNAFTLAYGTLAEASDGQVVFPPLTSITDQAGQTVAVSSTAEGQITAFTHPDGRVWTLGYDASGNLTSVKDGAGRTRSFAYNDRGLLSVVTGADGVKEITNAYDDVDRVVTQTDGAGNVRTIAYGADRSTTLTDALGNASTVDHNAKGQAVASHDAAGGVTRTGYDASYNPTTSVDANGNTFLATFDAFGRVLTSTDPLGNTTSYTYNATGDLTSVTAPDPNGNAATTSFVLNSDGRAIETHLPDGTTTYATYNGHGDVTSSTDALGNVTTFEYDARGNVVEVTDPLGGTSTTTYDLANRATSTTDALGNTTTMAWDAADNLTSLTDALGQVTEFEHDANGSLISQTDVRGLVTTYEYNVNVQRTAVNNPDGTRVTFAYDAEHHLVKQTNQDGTARTWEYDALGRATAMVDEAGERWITVYDAIGNATATIDPEGNRTETSFDALGRPTAITDAVGNTSSLAYNPAGLVASSTDALGRTTVSTYDAMGRVVGHTNPDGSTATFGYDANGNLTAATDERGFTTAYEYDALDRQTAVVDALGGRGTMEYDAIGNVTASTNEVGARTEYDYDALQRRIAVTDALGGTLATDYDPAGNVLSSTDALGRVTDFSYDSMNRLVSTTLPDGAVTTYQYTEMGDLATVTDALGATIGYEYAPTGRQTARIDESGQRWVTEYDAAGNAVANVDPAGARTTMEYDAAGRQVATTDALGARTSVTLDAAGQVATATDALGRATRYDYDAMGRVTSVTLPDSSTNTFAYDAGGNVVASTDGRGFATSFEYDALGRQTVATDALGGTSTTEYDAVGNITATLDASGAKTTSAYDALSRPTSTTDTLGGTSLTEYDAVGNVVTSADARGKAASFTYDPMDRLATSTLADGATTTYAYDAMGRTVAVIDPLGATVRHEYDAAGRETARIDQAGERWATEYDVVGNAVASVDPTGARTAMEYDAVGQQVASTDPLGARTAREFDAVGAVVGVTDALGQTTAYAYDARDRLISVTTPEGATTTFGYDADGNATTVRNPLGDVVSVEFDALGRAVAQVNPDGGRVVTAYDAVGRIVSETDPNGSTKRYTYDALGRVTQSTDGEGFTTTNSYDEVGNLLSVTNPLGGVQTSTYDAVNRPVTVTDEVGSTTATAYDLAGRVSSTTDPAGVVTRFTYDARGLLTATTENFVAAATPSASVNVTTLTAYDARGLATSVTDPRGNATTYSRDAAGRLTAETDALGRVTQTEYDAVGRPVAVTAADGSVTDTSYTPDGRVAQVVYPDKTVSSTYDGAGNRVTLVDSLGTSSWAYDWDGRVVSETDVRGNTQTHTFDSAGNEVATGLSDGRTITREFDGRGLAVSQTDLTGTTEYSYDANGRLAEALLPSGVTSTVERDGAGRVTGLDHVGITDEAGSWLSPCLPGASRHGWSKWWVKPEPPRSISIDYTYEERGLVSRREFTVDGSVDVTTYAHDALGRLVESVSAGDAWGPGHSRVAGDRATYGWDAASNLVFESHTDDVSTARPRDGFVVDREVDAANQLVESVRTTGTAWHQFAEVSTYAYDERGNRVSETVTEGRGWHSRVVGHKDFTYDGRDDLVVVKDFGEHQWSWHDDSITRFVRDGVGRALSVIEDWEVTERVFTGLDVVVEGDTQVVRDPMGGVQSEVTTSWSGHPWWGHPVSETQDVLKDLLGSPVGIAVDGVVSADLQVFGDFGDVTDAASWDTVTGFTGQVSTGGLVEFATRTFDPASRVWLQDDSYRGATTRAASLNRYAYVEGAPESFVDVLGFYRAAAAIRAQALAAAQAAYDEALKALRAVEGEYLRGSVSVPGLGTLPRYIAQGLVGSANYQAYLERFLVAAETRRQVQAQEWAAHKAAAQAQRDADARAAAKREADSHKNWWDRAVDATVNTVTNVVTAQAGGSKCSSIAGAAYFVFSAGVNCQYDQAQYYDFDPVEQLDIAWHGVVNFGGGVANALADTVDLVVDVGQTTFNALSPTCWTDTFCAAIPNIPSVPIYGDPDLYRYSQTSGYVTTLAVEFVATGGAGAIVDGFSAGVTAVRSVPRLVTDLPGVVNGIKNAVTQVVPAAQRVIPMVRTVLSGAADDVVRIIQAPGDFITSLRTGLHNPVTTPGGIFGTPPTTVRPVAQAPTAPAGGAANGGLGADASTINHLGGTHNCVACAIAGDSTLAGNPASALDLYPGMPIPGGNALIEDFAGASWRAVSGQAAIDSELLAAGNGARGIVYGTDGTSAHVWNAVVQNGRVNYVDFQGIGPSGAAAFDAWNDFRFVRTN